MKKNNIFDIINIVVIGGDYMKKLVSGLLVSVIALSMTGCGNGNKLTCTTKDEDLNAEMKIVVSFKGDEATSAKSVMTFADKTTASTYYSLITTFGGEEIDAKLDGKKLIIGFSKEDMADEYGDVGTKEEMKIMFEEEGYTCK